MKKHFIWLPEENKTICEIKDNNLVFTGIAICHEHDQDFKSEITGGYIAESRADIKYYQHTHFLTDINFEAKNGK